MNFYKSCFNLKFWKNAHLVWHYWCAKFQKNLKFLSATCKTISISSAVTYTRGIFTPEMERFDGGAGADNLHARTGIITSR
jgi:hypothetical protein